MFNVGIIGAGTVGSAVALLLKKKGYIITGISSKTSMSAARLSSMVEAEVCEEPQDLLEGAEIIFITTPDYEIRNIADKLAQSGSVKPGQIFFHMSGALSVDVLNSLRLKGAGAGSLHPLQSFAGIERAAAKLPGSFFAVQGDQSAVRVAMQIVQTLGGNAFPIREEDKPLYHLGAVVASNYFVSLMHYAVSVFKEIGMDEKQALNALLPLVKGTFDNLQDLGPVKSLTGPVSRGDTETIKCHLEALTGFDSDMKNLYRILGRYACRIALDKGSVDGEKAQEMINIFDEGEQSDVSK